MMNGGGGARAAAAMGAGLGFQQQEMAAARQGGAGANGCTHVQMGNGATSIVSRALSGLGGDLPEQWVRIV